MQQPNQNLSEDHNAQKQTNQTNIQIPNKQQNSQDQQRKLNIQFPNKQQNSQDQQGKVNIQLPNRQQKQQNRANMQYNSQQQNSQDQQNRMNMRYQNQQQNSQDQQNRTNTRYQNQQQNSQEQQNRLSFQHPNQQQTQQNEPRQQEEQKLPEDSKDQEKPKQQDTSNHSDHPRNVEIQKRSSDSKVFFMSKTGSVITSKKDDSTSPKPLSIVTPNKDSTQSLPQPSQIHSSYSESSVPVIEKRQRDKQLDFGLTLDVIPVDILKNSENKLTDARLPKSRGYIILQNYLLEMNNDKSGKSQYGHFKPQRSKSKQNIANLIDTNGYLPSIMYKNVNMWDSKSDEAFRMNVNQSFNRLTKDKINQVLNDLIPQVNSTEREKLVVDIFVTKASSEKGFSLTYAEFVKELSKSKLSLARSIIETAIDKLEDYALNPADEQNDYECESSIGFTSFVAALISNGLIQDGAKHLQQIIDAIPSDNINPTLIEMLKNFVLSVGKNFIQNIDKKVWEKLYTLIEQKDIQSRVRYLIVDTLEVINGTQIEQEKPHEVTESAKSLVRNGFASFQEDYTIVPSEVQNMKSIDFFEGSMVLFPDIKDIYDFTYYQCFVVKKKEYRKPDIINTLQKYIRNFAEQEIDMDVRHIWTNISVLLCQMIIQGLINTNEAQNLHRQIYYRSDNTSPNDDWNPINDLKFFIQDYIDFSEPIEISSNIHDAEIRDALNMPNTINDPNITEIKKVSRLIAVACIRSVFAQFRTESDQSISGLTRWKGILSSVNRKCNKAVRETLEEEINNYEYVFNVDDVIKFIT